MEMQNSVELYDIDNVVPYENNPKVHNDGQVEKIAKSIKEFGFDQPIVVDGDGVVIKGHGRRLAAIKMGLERVPVVVRSDLNAEQARAARLADNRVAEDGDTDANVLQEELAALSEVSFDLGSLGFEDRELDFLTEELDVVDEDALVEDPNAGAESTQTEKTEATQKEAQQELVKVTDILGFSKINTEQSRALTKLMGEVEETTGLEGADALAAFAEKIITEE